MRYIVDYLFKSRLQSKEPKQLERFEIGWTKTDLNSLEFLHKEASVRVQDTVQDHHEISKKAFSMLLVMIGLSSALCGFLLTNKVFGAVDIMAILALIVCLLSIYLLSELTRPNAFRAPGRVPEKVLVNKIFDPNRSVDDRKKLIVYQELLNCQAQIDLNQYYNTTRLKIIDFIIRLVLLSFASLGFVLLIVKLNN